MDRLASPLSILSPTNSSSYSKLSDGQNGNAHTAAAEGDSSASIGVVDRSSRTSTRIATVIFFKGKERQRYQDV